MYHYNVHNSTDLMRLLPPVLRARDFHLYLEGGRRLTDLWQLGGKAILGHKPSRLIKELKNTAERGLFAPFPHHNEKRFLKALARLFPLPDLSFRIYASHAALESALENAGFSGRVEIWRPFLEKTEALEKTKVLEKTKPKLFVPVLPWVFCPEVLVLDKSLEDKFPPGDLLSPFILAPATRSIYDLIAAGDNGGRPSYPRIRKALSNGKNKWKHQGIYIFPANELQSNWKQVWEYFLEKGFLIPPNPREPLILPGILSKGEETKLASLFEE